MSVSPVNTNVSFQKPNKKKMDNVTKGIIIGGVTTSAIGGGIASLTMLSARTLKSLKGQSFGEKRTFLNDVITPGKRELCYSKSIKNILNKFKQPLLWVAIVSAGTAIGSIIGIIIPKNKDKQVV